MVFSAEIKHVLATKTISNIESNADSDKHYPTRKKNICCFFFVSLSFSRKKRAIDTNLFIFVHRFTSLTIWSLSLYLYNKKVIKFLLVCCCCALSFYARCAKDVSKETRQTMNDSKRNSHMTESRMTEKETLRISHIHV